MGQPILNLDDRGDVDARMLAYTSALAENGLEITGTPSVTPCMSSDHPDGVVIATPMPVNVMTP